MVSGFAVALALGVAAGAQPALTDEQLTRVETAVRAAFAPFYALPKDTAAADLGTWVLDTNATTPEGERSGRWRIFISRLTDTGKDLTLSGLVRGTSPAQIAESVVAMKRLEGKISRAEADATLDITIALDEPNAPAPDVARAADRSNPRIPGADSSVRIRGEWITLDDRELEIEYERWSPPTLLVRFGRLSVRAQGAEEMIDRLVAESKWEALAGVGK